MRHHKKQTVEPTRSRKLHLLLRGCQHQHFFHVDELIELLDVLPDSHLAGVQYIEFKANTARRGGAYVQNTVNWYQLNQPEHGYIPYRPKRYIEIYRCQSKEQLQHAMYHEIAHFVYFQVISARQRKDWVTNIYPGSSFVSQYAKTNAAEDFAESYVCYLGNGSMLQRVSPQKYHFLHLLF
tara:strand:- start:720 stop:1262 length:543 start_codon:yes stop_codon:yes gene_type:complete